MDQSMKHIVSRKLHRTMFNLSSCVLKISKRPPAMATKPGFRRFCSSLNKRYVPPSNRTSKRIGLCALSVMRKKKRLLFAKTRKEMGSKFASCSFDMVSNVIHILAC